MKLKGRLLHFALGVLVGVVGSVGVYAAVHHTDIVVRPTPLEASDIVEQAQIDAKTRFARQVQDGQTFARTLVQSAVKDGEVADAEVRYIGPNSWGCRVWVRDDRGGAHADGQAETPERACTKTVLLLNQQHDL